MLENSTGVIPLFFIFFMSVDYIKSKVCLSSYSINLLANFSCLGGRVEKPGMRDEEKEEGGKQGIIKTARRS